VENTSRKPIWPLFIVGFLLVGAFEIVLGFLGLLFSENGEKFFGACLVTGSAALIICSISRFFDHWSTADEADRQVLCTYAEKGVIVFSVNVVLVVVFMVIFKALFIEDEPWPSVSSCLVYAAVINTAWVWLFTTFRKTRLWNIDAPANITDIVVMVNAGVGFVTAILLFIARGELMVGICAGVNAAVLWAMCQHD